MIAGQVLNAVFTGGLYVFYYDTGSSNNKIITRLRCSTLKVLKYCISTGAGRLETNLNQSKNCYLAIIENH